MKFWQIAISFISMGAGLTVLADCIGGGGGACLGHEGCACYGNGTCNAGLVCESNNKCVGTDAGTGGWIIAGGSGGSATGSGGPGNDTGSSGALTTAGGGDDAGGGSTGASGSAATGELGATSDGGQSTTGPTGSTGSASASSSADGTGTTTSGNSGTTTSGNSGTTTSGNSGTTTSGNTGTTGATTGTGSSATGASTGGSTGMNLIVNGDFSDGIAHWNPQDLYSETMIASYQLTSGTVCFAANVDTISSIVLGWPMDASEAVPLTASTSYTFSYDIWGSLTYPTLTAKVGHATTPYTSDFTATETPTSTHATYSHVFKTTTADTGAGVAFSFELYPGDSLCFDNVKLAPTSP